MAHRILSLALTLWAGLALAQYGATCQYGDFLFHKSGAGMEICGYTGADTDVILPEYVEDGSGRNAVVSIGEEAFYGSRFETVVIPASIRKIGPLAFCNSRNLRRVVLPPTLQTVCNDAFALCRSLRAVVFPDSVADMPWMVLGEARNVETVVLGRGVRSIGPGFLTGDYSVKEIYIMSPEPPELVSADSECGRFGPFHQMSMPDVYVPAESLGMYAARPADRHSMHCDWESQGSWDYFYRYKPIPDLFTVMYDTELTVSPEIPVAIDYETVNYAGVGVYSEEWTSSDATVATVSDGLVTGHANGSATVSLSVRTDSGVYHSKPCVVTVEGASPLKKRRSSAGIPEIGAEGEDETVYTLDGVKVGSSCDNLEPGCYMVKKGSSCRKIVVI